MASAQIIQLVARGQFDYLMKKPTISKLTQKLESILNKDTNTLVFKLPKTVDFYHNLIFEFPGNNDNTNDWYFDKDYPFTCVESIKFVNDFDCNLTKNLSFSKISKTTLIVKEFYLNNLCSCGDNEIHLQYKSKKKISSTQFKILQPILYDFLPDDIIRYITLFSTNECPIPLMFSQAVIMDPSDRDQLIHQSLHYQFPGCISDHTLPVPLQQSQYVYEPVTKCVVNNTDNDIVFDICLMFKYYPFVLKKECLSFNFNLLVENNTGLVIIKCDNCWLQAHHQQNQVDAIEVEATSGQEQNVVSNPKYIYLPIPYIPVPYKIRIVTNENEKDKKNLINMFQILQKIPKGEKTQPQQPKLLQNSMGIVQPRLIFDGLNCVPDNKTLSDIILPGNLATAELMLVFCENGHPLPFREKHPFKSIRLSFCGVCFCSGDGDYYHATIPMTFEIVPSKYLTYHIIFNKSPPCRPYLSSHMSTPFNEYLSPTPFESYLNFSRLNNIVLSIEWDMDIIDKHFNRKGLQLKIYQDAVNILCFDSLKNVFPRFS